MEMTTTTQIKEDVLVRPTGTGREASAALVFNLTIILLVSTIWIATRPYYGVIDDARFYMIEALQHLHPGRYATDPYFRFGSQGEFTLFPKLYAQLVSLLGISAAALAATIAAQMLWIGAVFY